MLLPTEDSELINKSAEALRKKYMGYGRRHNPIVPWKETPYQNYWISLSLAILKIVEKEGYYKGLPESIAEALNSGDGTYRP